MQELNRFDRAVERLIYSNAKIAELYQNGLLSRAEAEVLDIIQANFTQGQQEDTHLAEVEDEEDEAQWEPSCLAIVHQGTVIPVLDLEEIIQRPRTSTEKLALCKQVSSIIYDVLLALLDEEGGGKA